MSRAEMDAVMNNHFQFEAAEDMQSLKDYARARAHVQFRLLHVFEFKDGLIARADVWIDYPSLQAQLAAAD
jgi:predicted ester cyclase